MRQTAGDWIRSTLKFFSFPQFSNEQSSRRAELLSFLVNLHILIATVVTLYYGFVAQEALYAISALISIFPALAFRVLIHRQHLTLASILFVGMLALLMPVIAYTSNSSVTSANVSVYQTVTMVMAGLLLGGRGALAFFSVTMIINSLLVYAELQQLFPVDSTRDPFSVLISQFITFGAIAILLGLTNRIIKQSFKRAQESEQRFRQLNRELEQRVLERTAQLEDTNRELDTFSYSVSHDLRAPLRAVITYAGILREESKQKLNEDEQEILHKIITSGQRMSLLIEKLLNFSHLGRKAIQPQELDMNEIVRLIIQSNYSDLSDRQLEWILSDLGSAQADPILIQQVFDNLIGNAVKFTKKRQYAVIEVGCQNQGTETVYFVRDNGAGFDMTNASQLFGVFHRLHDADEFEGTGIGLATVQRILERHGGRIWAEAAVDQGATFYFTLASPMKSGLSQAHQ